MGGSNLSRRGSLVLLGLLAACGGDDSSNGASGGSAGSSGAGMAGAGGGVGGADSSLGGGGRDGAPEAPASDAPASDAPTSEATLAEQGGADTALEEAGADLDSSLPCGAEKEACCNQDTCTTSGLTCSDTFCLVCSLPAYAEGCTNVARGMPSTATQTSPNEPLVNATDADPCTPWGTGDYANIADSGVEGTFWQLDLGVLHTISGMMLWMAQTPPDALVQLKIEYSADGSTFTAWRDAAGFAMMLHANEPWVTTFHDAGDLPISLRYFKITFVDSPSWISIRDLALFECSSDGGI